MRSFDPAFEPKEIRRLEVITGVGGRRAWSDEDKGRIVAESFAAGANVSAVARRYGLRPQQVYTWRRLASRRRPGTAVGRGAGVRPGYRRRERTGAIGDDAVGHRRDRNHRHRDPGRARRGDWRHLRDVLRAVKAAR
jgi:transposase-like protein